MIGRLVQNQEVGLAYQHRGQRHPLLLPARERAHRLFHVIDFELREHLADALLVVPGLEGVHACGQVGDERGVGAQEGLLVLADDACGFGAAVEHLLDDGVGVVEHGALAQITHADAVVVDHAAAFGRLVAGQDVEQGGFARAVARNQRRLLPLIDAECQIIEEFDVAPMLCQVLYRKIVHCALMC